MRSEPSTHELVIVLDENLSGQSIFQGLRALDIPVKIQTELMARGSSDEKVLETLSRHPNHFLLSKDADFHRKPVIKAALSRHGAGAFIITAHKGRTGSDLVNIVGLAWKRMQKFLRKNKAPFVVKIFSDGKIEKVV